MNEFVFKSKNRNALFALLLLDAGIVDAITHELGVLCCDAFSKKVPFEHPYFLE